MHPYYSPGSSSPRAATVSMAAYLTFWAVVVAIAGHEMNQRFPRAPEAGADRSLAVLRERYAAGEIDRERFLQAAEDLRRTAGAVPAATGGRR